MAKNNEAVNNNVQDRDLMQFKMMMQSPVFKKAMKDAEKYFEGKKAELELEKGKLQLIKDSIGSAMLGKPEYRGISTVKVIDGTLLSIQTNDFSIVTSVKPVKNFEELNLTQRSTLFNENKKLYKALEMDLYKPSVTDKILNLMILEDEVQYEKFDILASEPSKPTLTGLDSISSSDAVRQYTEGMANFEARLKAYNDDIGSYTNGTMNNDKYETEEKIKVLEAELRG